MFRYRFARVLFNIIMFFLGTKKVAGQENQPDSGPYIVVTNHMSVGDTPLLLISFPPTRIRFFAGEKWESHPVYGPFMRWLGAIYINRGSVDRAALRQAIQALQRGDVFGLAPEGTRSKVGALNKGRNGAAYLASRARVPLLPVGIVGTDKLFANIRRLRRTHLETHVGRPFTLPDLHRRPRSQDYDAYTHLIMVHIAAQLPESYHGYYRDSPALKALLAGEDPWPWCLEAESESVKRET